MSKSQKIDDDVQLFIQSVAELVNSKVDLAEAIYTVADIFSKPILVLQAALNTKQSYFNQHLYATTIYQAIQRFQLEIGEEINVQNQEKQDFKKKPLQLQKGYYQQQVDSEQQFQQHIYQQLQEINQLVQRDVDFYDEDEVEKEMKQMQSAMGQLDDMISSAREQISEEKIGKDKHRKAKKIIRM